MSGVEVLTVGRISIDLYCGEVGADWVQARTFSKAVGGSPTNVAIAAARLGRRAALYTKVGDDPFGAVALGELRDFGVDVSFVGVETGAVTPLAFATLDPPEEPSLHFRRAAPVPDFQLRGGEVPADVVRDVRILWVSGGALAVEPCRSTVQGMLASRAASPPARHPGSPHWAAAASSGWRSFTVLDLDYRPSFWSSRAEASRVIGAAVASATVAVGNREECSVAVGVDDPAEAARALLERGVSLAIVKLGGDGVLVADASGERFIAPAPVDVVCGLGAGDAFGGALCHGLLSGWPADEAVAFANAAGGIVASRLLCSQAMPYEHEVRELVAQGSVASRTTHAADLQASRAPRPDAVVGERRRSA